MQQQRSQEDSYIHKRLIANINLGPVQRQKETLHNSYIYSFCLCTGPRLILAISLLCM